MSHSPLRLFAATLIPTTCIALLGVLVSRVTGTPQLATYIGAGVFAVVWFILQLRRETRR
jgi:hypothetical protein